VHQLRRSGDATRRERVNGLLRQGVAGWCPVVRLELWRGVTNDTERRVLERYASVLSDYAITDAVWERAFRLADLDRAAGLADLLIFACARVHSVELAHDDGHFDQLATLRP
jgi:predicted nucleic acid-binding protein